MTNLVAVATRLAARLADGATLLVHGPGDLAPDAHHVVVEFLHPVIVGKAAYPALCVTAPRDVELLGRAGDVALALGPSPEFLDAARQSGLEAFELEADGHGFVTSYHLLWEITQLILESADRRTDADLAFLYGGADTDRLRADAERSLATKRAESTALCAAVLARCGAELDRCAAEIGQRVTAGGRVLTFGNGGSSTDAAALALTLRGSGVAAVCLADETAVVTALANDVGVEHVFARQIAALAGPGDVAVGLSTSGGSANVLAAFDRARHDGLLSIGFAGYDGGAMATVGTIDHLFVVDSDSVHRIQEAQAALYLALADRIGH
ncbi:SIS domain-containing protein [Pseudonocardia kunmingensis]|uniref:Phosphoheptose isomerase n=1 Tax=Pseudonocardia kunmingensis TaxID=630975 RepID=A0A543DP66_9PSEU|nr:SIS domain-containing protein [Pseudonocardia kunmingensis]TQM11109.1 phosphoheptose isomerase [Pseudonocardia kunmingensis]